MINQKIKVIAFDIGAVLTKTDFKEFNDNLNNLAEKYNVDGKKFYKLRIKNFHTALIGKRTDKQFKSEILTKLNIRNKKEFSNKWDNALELSMGVDKEIYSLIPKLKKYYTIISFSNVTPMFHKIRLKKGVYRHFKHNILSHQTGLKKPRANFYKLLIKTVKVKPQEILLIDDGEANIIAANKLGMKAILYKNNKQLFKDLKKLGVKLK